MDYASFFRPASCYTCSVQNLLVEGTARIQIDNSCRRLPIWRGATGSTVIFYLTTITVSRMGETGMCLHSTCRFLVSFLTEKVDLDRLGCG